MTYIWTYRSQNLNMHVVVDEESDFLGPRTSFLHPDRVFVSGKALPIQFCSLKFVFIGSVAYTHAFVYAMLWHTGPESTSAQTGSASWNFLFFDHNSAPWAWIWTKIGGRFSYKPPRAFKPLQDLPKPSKNKNVQKPCFWTNRKFWRLFTFERICIFHVVLSAPVQGMRTRREGSLRAISLTGWWWLFLEGLSKGI